MIKISIILTTYNSENQLQEVINSIKYHRFAVVIRNYLI